MKLDLSKEVKSLNGDAMLEKINANAEPKAITYENIIVNAIMGVVDGEKISGEEKFKRYNLAKDIHDKPEEVELSLEDRVLIKERVNRFYSVLIYGRVCDFLEK